MKIKNILRSILTLLSGNIAASGLAFICIVIAARSLGTSIFGQFALITSFIMIVDKLVNFQSWMAVVNFGIPLQSEVKDSEKKNFFSLISFCISIDIITAIVGFLVAWILAPFLASYMDWDAEIVNVIRLGALTLLFKVSSFSMGIYRIFGEDKLQSIILVISALIKLIGFSIVYLFDGGLIYFILAFVISDISLSILYFISSFKVIDCNFGSVNLLKYGINYNKKYFNYVVWTNLSGLVDLPAKELDVLIIGLLTNESTAGIYKIIKQIMNMISRLVSPVYQVVFPKQRELISNDEFINAVYLSFKISAGISVVMSAMCLICYLYSDLLVAYSFGSGFDALESLIVLCVAIRSLDVVFTTLHSLYIAKGHVKGNTIIVLLCNMIMMIMFFVFIPTYGIKAAIYSLGFQSIATLLIKVIHLRLEYMEEKIVII